MAKGSKPSDATQQTRLEAVQDQLRATDERLHLACVSAGVGTWDWNIGEDDILMDDQLYALFGLKQGEFDGKLTSFFPLLHPDDVDRTSAAINASVETDAEFDTDYRVIWPNKEVHYIKAKGKVYRDEAGAPLRMTGVCWEVTAQVRADQLQARLASIVAGTDDAIVSLDMNDNIVTWNDSAERLFRCARTEAIGMPISDIVPADRRAEFNERLGQAHRNQPASPMLSIHLRRDNAAVDVAFTISPIVDPNGDVSGVSVIARDVTARVTAEKELKASVSRIQQTNEELKQFAYVASHDLREPLRTVRSFCQLLQEKYTGRLDEQADSWIGFMSDATLRMQQLIDDLLEYSRLDSNAQPPSNTSFRQAVTDAMLNLKVAIEESGASVECGELPTLKAEHSQITQLFQNLIGNAIKYSNSPPKVVISCQKNGEEWQFSIADNGIGIKPKFHRKVFEMFQRLHARGTYEGTGIGLSLCRKIVSRHGGGRIWIESPDIGTIVHFTIPARDSLPKVQASKP